MSGAEATMTLEEEAAWLAEQREVRGAPYLSRSHEAWALRQTGLKWREVAAVMGCTSSNVQSLNRWHLPMRCRTCTPYGRPVDGNPKAVTDANDDSGDVL